MAPGQINIRRDNPDPFYRYKMEPLQSKVEGKGNGIKTVVANLSRVAEQLARPPSYVIKYFGFELGAQTNIDPKDDRWIINGAHEASKLQDYLDGFISKFVLCRSCKNPETVVNIKDERIILDCKACGERTDVDPRQKLAGFIIKNAPKKGKKDKSTKKADRKARKEAERNGHENGSPNGNGENSPDSSGSDHGADENGDLEVEAGSDDELTRRINAEAKELDATAPAEVEWSVDMSEAAIKARAQDLPDDLKRALVIEGEEDGDGEGNAYDVLGKWIQDTAEEKGGIDKIDSIDIYKKAKEFGIEKKHKTLTVLAQTIFDENIVKQVDSRASMLKNMITSEKHERAFLGGTERFFGVDHPDLIPQISTVLMKYYHNDLINEETLKSWGKTKSKKYVDISTSKKVRKSAEKFMEWLENAESEDEDEGSDSE
ncbi:eukaryotic translation initiation factor 5 [Elasticomyces elasticus]|nr:eukaryotic translation initiation factor 5 [Elasticomyces elasticus]